MQQTFLTAYGELMHHGPPGELRAWLYGVARHRCLAALRGRHSRPPDAVPEQGADHVISTLTMREDLRATLTDLARLPHDQRTALTLAELEDVSHAEIALILGCPRDKVKALVYQARSSLIVGRAARDISCAEIRAQLRTLRGAALRRAVLRRHLRDCADCRAFRERLRGQRRRLGLLLPAGPTIGLKRGLLGLLLGSGSGGAGSAALTAAAVSGAQLTVTALVATAVLAATDATAPTPSPERRVAAQPVAYARAAPAPGRATPGEVEERPVMTRVRRSASSQRGRATRERTRLARATPVGGERPVAPSLRAPGASVPRGDGAARMDVVAPQKAAGSDPAAPSSSEAPEPEARPTPHRGGRDLPAERPQARSPDLAAKPPKTNRPAAPPRRPNRETPAHAPQASRQTPRPQLPQAHQPATGAKPNGVAGIAPPGSAPESPPTPTPSAPGKARHDDGGSRR